MKRLLLTAMLLCIAASTGCNGSFSPCFLRRDVDVCDPCQAQYDGGLLLNNGQRPGGWLSNWWRNRNIPGQSGYVVGYPGDLNGCGCEGGCDSCNAGCNSCGGGGCSSCNGGCSSCGGGGCSTCNGGSTQAVLSNDGTLITPDGMTISQDGQLISPGNGAFVIPNADGGVMVGPTPAEAADSVPTLPGPAKKGM